MGRQRKGFIEEDKTTGKLTARLTYTDRNSKRRNIRRRVKTKTEGYLLLKRILRELEGQVVDGDTAIVSFAQLANWYEKTYIIEPVYSDGHKISGLRDT